MRNGQLPKNWKLSKLSAFCRISSGGTPARDKANIYFGGNIPWVKSGELENKPIPRAEETITELGLANSSAKIFPKDTVLVALYGATVGKTGILEIEAATNQAVAAIIPDDRIADFTYLFFFLQYYNPNLLAARVGGAQPNISQEILKNIQIPLPPLPIQKKIASILEKADAAREKRRQANQLSEQFLQSVFLEMFGDPATNTKGWPVGIIADAVKYSEYGTSKKSNNEKQGYPIIGMGNITYDGQLDLSKLNYVNLSVDNFEKLKLRRGDLIFNRTNSTELVGKTTYWNLDMDAVIASYLVKLRLNKEFDSIWFLYLLNIRYFKIVFMRRCKKAVGQSNISPTLLKEFPIYIPPLSEQQKFAELVEKVDVLRTKQRQSEQELETLFNSLMQRAFRGEL